VHWSRFEDGICWVAATQSLGRTRYRKEDGGAARGWRETSLLFVDPRNCCNPNPRTSQAPSRTPSRSTALYNVKDQLENKWKPWMKGRRGTEGKKDTESSPSQTELAQGIRPWHRQKIRCLDACCETLPQLQAWVVALCSACSAALDPFLGSWALPSGLSGGVCGPLANPDISDAAHQLGSGPLAACPWHKGHVIVAPEHLGPRHSPSLPSTIHRQTPSSVRTSTQPRKGVVGYRTRSAFVRRTIAATAIEGKGSPPTAWPPVLARHNISSLSPSVNWDLPVAETPSTQCLQPAHPSDPATPAMTRRPRVPRRPR